MDISSKITSLANAVVHVFEQKEQYNHEQKISVNRFVSEIASWYEKLRNAMELDDSVLLKNAIERVIKRRLMLGGRGETVAEPLLRELVWARYFQDNTLPQSYVAKVSQIVDLYLELKHKILEYHKFNENTLNDWILDLMSCQISLYLQPNLEREAMSNFMYHILKDGLVIKDDSEDTKNVQVYLAVRKAFAKDDLPFLRFHLFRQLFPTLTKEHVDQIAKSFLAGYNEINRQLNYRLKDKIHLFVKRQTPVFFILEDVLRKNKGKALEILSDAEKLGSEVLSACDKKYRNIASKVRTAIVRSVFFLLLTKVIIAFLVEGSYDKYVYGHIMWNSFVINIVAPPLLLVIMSFFIKPPNIENSRRILAKIKAVLFDEKPQLAPVVTLQMAPRKGFSILATIFGILWLSAFYVSFGLMHTGLQKLHFNYVSEGVFIFFITIVSFLSYRINLTANAYTVDARQGLLTPFIDFLLLPIIKVGMKLTDGISQINILIFIFDFLIEAPFKVVFSFIEQLFFYLHAKREDLE